MEKKTGSFANPRSWARSKTRRERRPTKISVDPERAEHAARQIPADSERAEHAARQIPEKPKSRQPWAIFRCQWKPVEKQTAVSASQNSVSTKADWEEPTGQPRPATLDGKPEMATPHFPN